MRIRNIAKGFTLIELLVVITIIGILATGAVSVYTSQIQKSRDSVRLTDIKAVQSGVEQYYQDQAVYPTKGITFSGVTIYVPKLPQDPKSGQTTTNSSFDYFYNVSTDKNGVIEQQYEISTTFEQKGNIDKKATGDGGDDNFRLEIGISIKDVNNSTKQIGIIPPANVRFSCYTTATNTKATCSGGSQSDGMLIRN